MKSRVLGFAWEEMSAPPDMTRRAALGAAAAAMAATRVNAMSLRPKGEKEMEKVLGIGGFFFRARDPKSLAKWYEDNLGVSNDMPPWRTEAGTTVFEPFKQDTEYFGAKSNQWMINFRVRNLDAMVKQLRANGVDVEVDPEAYPYGLFARLSDPEGNPIQLWQPVGKDPG